jgi:hypothetical protein
LRPIVTVGCQERRLRASLPNQWGG